MNLSRNYLAAILTILTAFSSVFAQQYGDKSFYLIDSLDVAALAEKDRKLVESNLELFHAATHDTLRIKAISTIIDQCWDKDVWPAYNKWLLGFLEDKLRDGVHNHSVEKVLKTSLASALNNSGYLHSSQGNKPDALDYYHKSLELFEELEDSTGMAGTYNNIGFIHAEQKNNKLALTYYHKALNIQKQSGNKSGMAVSYNNIGLIHNNKGTYDQALHYYQKSLGLWDQIADKQGLAYTYNNLGFIYHKQGNGELAFESYKRSFKLYEELGNKSGMATSLANLGTLQLMQGTTLGLSESAARQVARAAGEKGLALARELGSPDLIQRNAVLLNKVALKEGNYREALEMRNLEIQMRDSIASERSVEAAALQQAKYEYGKRKAIDDLTHQTKMAVLEKEKHEQRIILYAVSGGLALTVLLVGVILKSLKDNRRKNRIISLQKDEVEQQKVRLEKTHHQMAGQMKEIQDSIRYAKRIQEAILPSVGTMEQALGNGFVLYKPKDVVAGDFFWMEKHDGKVYFAAADCTGHGVPGAMVSVVCSNALSKALLEENVSVTGQLLDRTREIVIRRFAKNGEEVKDGMDISLCALDFSKLSLQWSGANNPLWIVRDGIVQKITHDKQPIGVHHNIHPFTTHDLKLQTGDSIYIFTDGYQDQFGGEKHKKFMARRLEQLLISIQHKTMNEQRDILDQEFEQWKGDLEQVDDVCVIGVRI